MIGLKSIVFLAGVTGTAAIRMECDSFTTEAIRIFSWRNSGVWRSILVGLKRSNTIWKADNEIYLLTISDLGFRILKYDFELGFRISNSKSTFFETKFEGRSSLCTRNDIFKL